MKIVRFKYYVYYLILSVTWEFFLNEKKNKMFNQKLYQITNILALFNKSSHSKSKILSFY